MLKVYAYEKNLPYALRSNDDDGCQRADRRKRLQARQHHRKD
jgi:hypothetical protein